METPFSATLTPSPHAVGGPWKLVHPPPPPTPVAALSSWLREISGEVTEEPFNVLNDSNPAGKPAPSTSISCTPHTADACPRWAQGVKGRQRAPTTGGD